MCGGFYANGVSCLSFVVSTQLNIILQSAQECSINAYNRVTLENYVYIRGASRGSVWLS